MTEKEKHRQYLNLLLLQDKDLSAIYGNMARELSSILRRYKVRSNSRTWHKNAEIKKEVDAVLAKYANVISGHISTASASAWDLSNAQNDDLVNRYTKGIELTKAQRERMYDRNYKALATFQQRAKDGFRLSDRVWQLTQQTRDQLETLLSSGLTEGRSAANLARDIQGYLKEPDKRFRRLKNKETGKLVLSTPGKNYHPGQGVYRSSYKNALRLARNEINVAYRMADHERRKKLPFVTGITVKLSPAHPAYDICDELQGDYPKDYVFTGWHTSCLCFSVSKLLSREDFIAQTRGGEISEGKFVKTIPPNAAKYIQDNSQRIQGLKSTPYFIQDNFKLTKNGYELKSGPGTGPKKLPGNPSKPLPKPTPASKSEFVLIKNAKGLTDHFAGFAADNSEYFARGFKFIKPTTRRGYNGFTDMNGEIHLNKSILEDVIQGINEIKATGKATLSQETALSTLHHEIMHNANKVGNAKTTKIQSRFMEMANEFVSRNRLPDFIQKLGGELQNTELISNRTNTGYNTMVRNYDHLLDVAKVDKKRALEAVEGHLINKSYTQQFKGLVDAVRDNSEFDIDVKDVISLVGRAESYDQERFKELLKASDGLFKAK